MGTHAGVRNVQSALRKTQATHFLKMDYSKFFPSVQRKTLHELIEKKISCQKTLDLIAEMVPRQGLGLPIGSLTSQLFANVYGSETDRFIQFNLKAKNWTRYMDDIVILSSNPYELRHWFEDIEYFSLSRLGMRMSRWQVSPTSRGINFLGYRIWPHFKLRSKKCVTRAKRKFKHIKKHGDQDAMARFLASWKGHANHANTKNLFNSMEI
jgi:hypothetical protein